MSAKYVKILFGFCFFTSSWQVNYGHSEGDDSTICIYHDAKYTCDCAHSNEQMEFPILDGNVLHISVANCNNIVIRPNFLLNTFGLRSISFLNVRDLVLQQNALSFQQLQSSTRLIVEFNNVTIKEIQSLVFNGNIDEITFTASQIDLIRPFAFTAFKNKAYFIKFVDTVFKIIDSQAFKKFSVDRLEFANSVFLTALPSRTFYDVDVKDFLSVNNCSFNGAFARAFSFSAVSILTFQANFFNNFEGECFEIKIGEKALIRNNTFTEIHPAIFREIQITPEANRRSEKLEFRLFDNIIQQTTSGPVPLYLNENFQIALGKLYYTATVNCDQVEQLTKYDFFKTYEDHVYLRFSDSGKFITYNQMLNIDCIHSSSWVYVGVGLGALVVLAIIVAVIAVYCVRKHQKNKLDIIMPEPKTYRETQIVLQIENAGLLKTDM